MIKGYTIKALVNIWSPINIFRTITWVSLEYIIIKTRKAMIDYENIINFCLGKNNLWHMTWFVDK